MECNVGKTDKLVRLLLGVALIILGHVEASVLLNVLGAIVLFTGYISFCLLYTLFKINTCGSKAAK